MKRSGLLLASLLLGCHRAPSPSVRVARACEVASFVESSGAARVVEAAVVPAGSFTPPNAPRPLGALPAFCRVRGETSSGPGSRIGFEVWVPLAEAWNGKLVTTGNGGYSPALNYGDMAYALRQGYAVVGGDTGHQTANPNDLSFGVGNRVAIADWGTHSIHAITTAARPIVASLRGRDVGRAYYYGCSTGGHQGYAEMQRYPEDFDGVIAGAPGNNRVRLTAGFLWQYRANRDRANRDRANLATTIVPAAKLPMITRAVVAACDGTDGVTDGVVDDPRACAFDVASLRCGAADGPACLTDAQIAAMRRMYRGARNPRTDAVVYPGWPLGSEAGWHQYWGTTEPARVDFWRLWVFGDRAWDPWSFDFDGDVARADSVLGPLVDQTSPDLDAFRRRGGKAIVYQGWQDPVTSAYDAIAYHDSVRARQGSQRATDAFFRLFVVPGMGHCAGGAGATSFGNQGAPPPVVDADHDLLAALDRWVERGVAPDRIVASRIVDGAVTRTRPLCPYPRRAVYRGTGSTDDAASFVCR